MWPYDAARATLFYVWVIQCCQCNTSDIYCLYKFSHVVFGLFPYSSPLYERILTSITCLISIPLLSSIGQIKVKQERVRRSDLLRPTGAHIRRATKNSTDYLVILHPIVRYLRCHIILYRSPVPKRGLRTQSLMTGHASRPRPARPALDL